MDEKILISISEIKERIKNILRAEKDKNEKILSSRYYYDSLKLNLIEIGEESKNLNNFIEKIKKKKESEISDAYAFRISLTHYYKLMDKKRILKFKKEKFPKFVEKIKELEKEFGGKKIE